MMHSIFVTHAVQVPVATLVKFLSLPERLILALTGTRVRDYICDAAIFGTLVIWGTQAYLDRSLPDVMDTHKLRDLALWPHPSRAFHTQSCSALWLARLPRPLLKWFAHLVTILHFIDMGIISFSMTGL